MAEPLEHPGLESLSSSSDGAELPPWSEQQLECAHPAPSISTSNTDHSEQLSTPGRGPSAFAEASEPSSLQQPAPAFSQEFLLKAAAKQGHRVPDSPEQQAKLLAKLTHLHLNGLQLQHLSSIKLCPKVQVLYLYDNQLTSVSSIGSNRLITHLYLQNNQLQSLDGLQELPLLQKLYLQNNRLAMISSLAAATRLEELHISDQQCPWTARQGSRTCSGMMQQLSLQSSRQQEHQVQEALCPEPAQQPSQGLGLDFSGEAVAADAGRVAQHHDGLDVLETGGLAWEAASLQALSHNLKVLVASNCGIVDPGPLSMLHSLRTLDLSNNLIGRIESLQQLLQDLQQLRTVDLQGNGCVREVKYRDYIILLAADSLTTLDGETVPAAHRAYLLRLHVNKLKEQAKGEQRGQPAGKLTNGQQQQGTAAMHGPAHAGGMGLAGMGVKLHPCKAPTARPPAVAGFNVTAVRVGAALGPAASHWVEQQQGHEGGVEP